MASLQGVVGGEYAKRQGLPDPVCRAIAGQYDHTKLLAPESEGARTAQRLCIADNLDKLVGFLGLNLVPTGSSDPFGLRRAATVLIEIALDWKCGLSFDVFILDEAVRLYQTQRSSVDRATIGSQLEELFIGRYAALFPEVRYDVLEAAAHRGNPGVVTPQVVPTRIRTLELLVDDSAFIQTATRPLNLLSAASKKAEAYSLDGLSHAEEELKSKEGDELLQLTRTTHSAVSAAIMGDDAETAKSAVKRLELPINTFMDEGMIMDPDPKIRFARLSLLASVSNAIGWVGDFTKIVIEG